MAAFLPLELITEILTKLSVKSLHRFKCVSKTWNSIITSPKFIKHHLHQTLGNPNSKKLIVNTSLLSSAISTVKLRFDTENYPLSNVPHRPPLHIVHSVHGLILVVDLLDYVPPLETVFLFNPSNKTQRLVPPAPSLKPAFVFGFGYDSVRDDYKVVRLAQSFIEDSGSETETELETCVYSMRNDNWESVYHETVSYSLQQTNAITVDDILYFVISKDSEELVFKCFDLRTNTFSLVNYTEFDSYNFDRMMFNLGNVRGCLCLLVIYGKAKSGPLYTDVWELKMCGKKEMWVKVFQIEMMHCKKFIRLVTYSKDEKSVLVEVDGIWFGWYDLVTKSIERVPVEGLRDKDWPFLAYTYVESLVPVVNNKVVSNKQGTRPKKVIKKNNFLSSGFKLKL